MVGDHFVQIEYHPGAVAGFHRCDTVGDADPDRQALAGQVDPYAGEVKDQPGRGISGKARRRRHRIGEGETELHLVAGQGGVVHIHQAVGRAQGKAWQQPDHQDNAAT